MQTRKILCAVLGLSCLLPASGFAQLFAPPGGKVSAGAVSRYIWRGFDVLPKGNPAFQGALKYVFGTSGFEATLFGSTALSGRDSLKALNLAKDLDEIDVVLRYYRSLSPSFGLTLGLNNYFFPRKKSFKQAYSPEVFAGLTLQAVPLFPTLLFYYDFNLGNDLYVRLNLQQFVPMGERLFLLKIGFGYNNGQYGVKSGFSDIEFNFSTDLRLGGFELTPSINWVINTESTVNPNNELWFGAFLSKRF